MTALPTEPQPYYNRHTLLPNLFQKEFQYSPTNVIVDMILNIDHLFGKIQLLGILLQRHGDDFMVGDAKGDDLTTI